MNFKPMSFKTLLFSLCTMSSILFDSGAQCEYCNCVNCSAPSAELVKRELLYNARDMEMFLDNALEIGTSGDEMVDLAIKYVENCRQISQKMDEIENPGIGNRLSIDN